MPLPTADETLPTPVIGAMAAAIVVLLVLAVLALRAGADDEVDLARAAVASETATDGEGGAEPAPDGPVATGEATEPAPDASAAPTAPAPTTAAPTVPLEDPDPSAQDAPLPAGTCIEDDGRASDVGSAAPVDCAVSHTGEVFATTAVQLPPDAAYPDIDVLDHGTRGVCQGPAFQEYVGTPHDQSALFTYALIPTEETWAAGDRAIACVAFHPLERTEGSIRGSGR